MAGIVGLVILLEVAVTVTCCLRNREARDRGLKDLVGVRAALGRDVRRERS